MDKFKGLLLFSDMDGTLFDNKNIIPQRNIDGIRYFVGEGGLFSVATGRSHYSLAHYVDVLEINAPCVALNGCCIYDYQKQAFLYTNFLNEPAKKATDTISKKFSDVNIVLFVEGGMVARRDPDKLAPCFDPQHVPSRVEAPKSVSEPWFKVVFVGEINLLEELKTELEQMELEGTEIVFTGADMLELLPSGISKAAGMLRVAAGAGIPKESICAIGDYFNDLEMLQNAGIGAAVHGAPKELEQAASFTVCNCNMGSVGHFIEILDEKF